MGPELPEEYGKYLRDGVWELRIITLRHQHRFLYSFRENLVLVTNAFLKKSQEVPGGEIGKAIKAIADWKARRGWEDL